MKRISVVIPCLNEEKGIGMCIQKIKGAFKNNNLKGEIIVVDNGCTDNSAKIAKNKGAKVISEPRIGYGNAYIAGFKHIKGDYVILGDADSTYDFNEIPNFLNYLKEYDFVLGSRYIGEMKKGSMPFLHRYVGNPLIRFLLNLLFKLKISDPSIGFVAIRKEALDKLGLKSAGMEFSSEMLIKIKKYNLKIKEIPIVYYERLGKAKLNTFRDGFRHLKFIIKTYFYENSNIP